VAGDDSGFCSTVTEFDDYGLGARMSAGAIEPFCVTLDSFHATYLPDGQPIGYSAQVRYTTGLSTAARPYRLKVNDPLRLPRANVYLLGHGYAPVLKLTDRYGHTVEQAFPFLPTDGHMTSEGAAAFPDVNVDPRTHSNVDAKTFVKQQIGFAGFFIPTASSTDPSTAVSVFPAADSPMLVITPYEGDLGLDSGGSHSVYSLDQGQIAAGVLKPVAAAPWRMRPGDSETLPDGSTVQFVGYRQWVSLSLRYDPGEKIVLAGAICLVIGLLLSLTGRRRRVWFRVLPEVGDGGRTVSVAAAGGLARAEYASFPAEFAAIVRAAGEDPERSDE
jgi:cytochrome c biogenesis protein